MSAMWLVPQHCLAGIAEAFNCIGQIEFYYSQFPKTMSSIAMSLLAFGMSVGSLIAGLIVSIMKNVTRSEGGENWLSNNINKAHYDYYYWLLTIMGALGFWEL
ncbi:protein nrt1/ ptr family 1.2 [Quercus suber]|uniref:Protein nrt1/ ptr family 1.2 n=1 Tax=Quercus suber TaxID=58331 RepID=A0AAW0K510_QUESU